MCKGEAAWQMYLLHAVSARWHQMQATCALLQRLQRGRLSRNVEQRTAPGRCKCCAPEYTCLARCTRSCNENLFRSALHTTDICRYPPVIDPKMEEAAEALQAIMQDLAAQKPQPVAPTLPSAEQPPSADLEAADKEEGAAEEAMDTDGEPGLGSGMSGFGGFGRSALGCSWQLCG